MATLSAAIPVLEDLLLESGSTIHFNGHGGDALFGDLSTALWSLSRSTWRGRYRWIWSHRVLNRTPLLPLVQMLLRRRSFERELASIASRHSKGSAGSVASYSSWIQPPEFHAALSSDARNYVAQLAQKELDGGTRPLSPDRTINEIMSYLAAHGAAQRRMNLVAERVYFDSPYLDLRIVAPAIALNIVDRMTARPAKPLLAAARPNSMNLDYFLRSDKGDYAADEFDQHDLLKRQVKELFSDGSLLEQLGLATGTDILRSVDAYSVDGASYGAVANLESAERWLRSVETFRNQKQQGGGHLETQERGGADAKR